MVGIVVAQDGLPMPAGNLLARRIDSHSNFQNGLAFIKNNGQKGPQIDTLLAGTYCINTKLFRITVTDAAIVPPHKVGLVNAETGAPLEQDEYVAKTVPDHKNFQDAATFLANGGQRGPQSDILKPGTYYMNPLIFKVSLQDVLNVEPGEVGVIVSNVGKDPNKANTDTALTGNDKLVISGIERYVVPNGYRGIQRDVLGPGIYYLNTQAYTPYKIPTTNLTIDWANSETTGTAASQLDPLTIVSKDGFEMMVEVKVICVSFRNRRHIC